MCVQGLLGRLYNNTMEMDPEIWGNLPEEIVNRICCDSVKMKGVHPFAVEIQTLNLINEILTVYENDLEFLSIDLDNDFPDVGEYHWGVFRKWKSLTPEQRRLFYSRHG
jgi:hypothetical protein